MLFLFNQLRQEFALELQVACLDHGLRGAEGTADAAFVRETAEQLGLPVTLGAVTGLRSEADARRARYDFLAETARVCGAHFVVVAHHADDQVETVLLNLLRGSGLRGLAAMRPRAPLPGHPQLTLLRPLLGVRRSELQAWCRAQGLLPRQDASNADLRLRRNHLRHETLPALRQLSPGLDQALLRLAAGAALDYDFIQQQLTAATACALHRSGQRIRLARTTFSGLHPALQRHVVLHALRQLNGQELTSGHVEQAVALAQSGVTGQRLSLPASLQLRLDYEDVIFEHRDAAPDWHGPLLNDGGPLAVCHPGETPLPGTAWLLEIGKAGSDLAAPQVRLSFPSCATLTLDTRRPGDRFAPPGLRGHTQSLKQWMINQRLPRAIRYQVPLLRVDGVIAAIFTDTQALPSALFSADSDEADACYCAIRRTAGPLDKSGLQ